MAFKLSKESDELALMKHGRSRSTSLPAFHSIPKSKHHLDLRKKNSNPRSSALEHMKEVRNRINKTKGYE